LGDEGSGFYIGQKALRAVMKAYDKRGPKTVLTDMLLNHFQLTEVQDLVGIYSEENIVPSIAKLSKYVFDAARKEDRVALGILEDSIEELMSLLKAANQNEMDTFENLLVLHGGLFSNSFFKKLFMEKINGAFVHLQVVQPEIPAVVGAYLLGIKESSI